MYNLTETELKSLLERRIELSGTDCYIKNKIEKDNNNFTSILLNPEKNIENIKVYHNETILFDNIPSKDFTVLIPETIDIENKYIEISLKDSPCLYLNLNNKYIILDVQDKTLYLIIKDETEALKLIKKGIDVTLPRIETSMDSIGDGTYTITSKLYSYIDTEPIIIFDKVFETLEAPFFDYQRIDKILKYNLDEILNIVQASVEHPQLVIGNNTMYKINGWNYNYNFVLAEVVNLSNNKITFDPIGISLVELFDMQFTMLPIPKDIYYYNYYLDFINNNYNISNNKVITSIIEINKVTQQTNILISEINQENEICNPYILDQLKTTLTKFLEYYDSDKELFIIDYRVVISTKQLFNQITQLLNIINNLYECNINKE